MGEFLQNFFTTLGVVWVILIILGFRELNKEQTADLTKTKNTATLDGNIIDMDKIVVAEAEHVTASNGESIWLAWDFHSKKFLGQNSDPQEIVPMLKSRFPEKTIVVKGLPE